MRWALAAVVVCGCATGDFDRDLETRRKINAIAGGFCTTPECHRRSQAERHHIENQQLIRMEGEANRELVASHLPSSGEASSDWWCYEGTIADRPMGMCDRNLDTCISMLQDGLARGVAVSDPACRRQSSATCLGANSVLDGSRVVRCMPSPETCGALRGPVETSDAWLNVSPCVPQ